MSKFDLRKLITQTFTNTIQECIEKDIPWQTPYIQAAPPLSMATGNFYRGVNVLLLSIASWAHGWTDPRWGTYNRLRASGAQVRKGSRGTAAVFYKMLPWTIRDEDTGTKQETQRPFMRYFTLFNADQCDGLEPLIKPQTSLVKRTSFADTYLTSAGANIKYSHQTPYYNIKKDYINLLHQDQYIDTETSTATESFYSAWTHELTHWTGAKDRNDRHLTGSKHSDEYAFEELIAEFGSIFLCNKLGITLQPKISSASYMASWLKRIKKDNNALVKATKHAQNAIDYLDQIVDINVDINGEKERQ